MAYFNPSDIRYIHLLIRALFESKFNVYIFSKCPTPKLEDLPMNSSDSRGIELCLDDQGENGLDDLVHEVWNELSRRQTPDTRGRASEFYRMLYNIVEKEIVAEEDVGHSYSCRDPYVDKLIEFMMDDLTAQDVRDPKAFCRLRLLSNLKMRIKAVTDEVRFYKNG